MTFLGSLFSSIGSSTQFEKYRLQFTNKNDTQYPNQYALSKLMETFEGKDKVTYAGMAYATILRKIQTSDSNNSWIYIFKNLVILDSAVQQKLFLEEISELELPFIHEFKDQNKKYAQFYTDGVIKKYYKLIKIRAASLCRRNSLFYIDRYQRQEFIEHMNVKDCQWHIEMSEKLFEAINEVIEYKKHGITEIKLIQWLFLQLLFKFVMVYSTELLAINRMLTFLEESSEKQILEFRKQVITFNKNANGIILFADQFKWIKGFENINYKEFDTSKSQILTYVQEAIRQKKNENVEMKVKVEQIKIDEKIIVNRKPRESQDLYSEKPIPRLQFADDRKSKKKIFQSYESFFSDQWPPKAIITIDMVQMMREGSTDDELEEPIVLDRSTMLESYNHRGSEEPVVIQYRYPTQRPFVFANSFSSLDPVWHGEP